MNRSHTGNNAKILGAIAGGLFLSLPALPSVAAPKDVTVSQAPIPAPTDTIVVPVNSSYSAVIPLSQIRVADLAPYPRNPCPSIYYEFPYTQRVVVPQVCRPNVITQRLSELGLLSAVRSGEATQTGTPGYAGPPYRSYPAEVPPREPVQILPSQ